MDVRQGCIAVPTLPAHLLGIHPGGAIAPSSSPISGLSELVDAAHGFNVMLAST